MNTTLIDEDLGHRRALQRKVLLHGPAAVVSWAITAWLLLVLVGGNVGALVGLTIMAIVTTALTFEAISALRDLRTEPITTRGGVGRVWSKGRFLFIGTIHYLAVAGRIFELRREAYASLQEGDTVEIEHWPHTNVVVSIRLVAADPDESDSRSAER